LPNQGSAFNICLPAVDTTEPTQPKRENPQPDSFLVANILLVEDEETVRNVVRRTLTSTGHKVLEAENGAMAMQIARTAATPIHLLLTDIVVSGDMNGFQLAQQLRRELPCLKIIFMSGYTQQKLTKMNSDLPVEFFLQKPFSSQQLLETVQLALSNENGH
jgi:two-component system cell cycle sensor histidine kinase/response regulator CckA